MHNSYDFRTVILHWRPEKRKKELFKTRHVSTYFYLLVFIFEIVRQNGILAGVLIGFSIEQPDIQKMRPRNSGSNASVYPEK